MIGYPEYQISNLKQWVELTGRPSISAAYPLKQLALEMRIKQSQCYAPNRTCIVGACAF
jgi:hypothetical protein